jgi:hypothetical protein
VAQAVGPEFKSQYHKKKKEKKEFREKLFMFASKGITMIKNIKISISKSIQFRSSNDFSTIQIYYKNNRH